MDREDEPSNTTSSRDMNEAVGWITGRSPDKETPVAPWEWEQQATVLADGLQPPMQYRQGISLLTLMASVTSGNKELPFRPKAATGMG